MFKVSFKENTTFPARKIQRYGDGKITIVTLHGEVRLPLFLQYNIPDRIADWMESCENVQVEVTMTRMHLIVRGKARRADADADNPILAGRIAECRAKIHLFRFMHRFLSLLYAHYCRLLSENTLTSSSPSDDTIAGAMTRYANLLTREQRHLTHLLRHEPDTESSPQP